MQYYLATWSFLVGLVIGSFLNVVIYRVPRRESLTHPGSHCPGCGASIRWRDNIPVASWLMLRGRCRSCRCPISVRYPLVETLTGAVFLAAYVQFGPSAALPVAWAVIAVVIALAFINHDLLIVPNRIVLPATICGLGAVIALDPGRWWHYLACCVGAGLSALLLAALRPGVTRLSEAKIALFLGAVLGPYVLVAIPLTEALRIFARIALLFSEKYRLRARAVFAPSSRQG